MNITQEKKDDLNLLVKIDLDTEDYMPKVESSIRDYSKKVQIKGFRKGKVPPGIVRKMTRAAFRRPVCPLKLP